MDRRKFLFGSLAATELGRQYLNAQQENKGTPSREQKNIPPYQLNAAQIIFPPEYPRKEKDERQLLNKLNKLGKMYPGVLSALTEIEIFYRPPNPNFELWGAGFPDLMQLNSQLFDNEEALDNVVNHEFGHMFYSQMISDETRAKILSSYNAMFIYDAKNDRVEDSKGVIAWFGDRQYLSASPKDQIGYRGRSYPGNQSEVYANAFAIKILYLNKYQRVRAKGSAEEKKLADKFFSFVPNPKK